MSTKEFAAQMKAVISDIKDKGTKAIECENLIAYLNEVENTPEIEPSPFELERFKADLQNWVETNKCAHEGDLEMFRSVISAGQNAIKSSFLLNGAAAVALLAFIGHLAQFKADKVPQFGACLLPFALGVLAIAFTSGLTYLSQWLYARPEPSARKGGLWVNIACMGLGLASYGLFIWGLFKVYCAFRWYA